MTAYRRWTGVIGLVLLAGLTLLAGSPAAAVPTKVPTDPRITAAVAAWKEGSVYVDPQYASVAGADQVAAMRGRIARSPVPVWVAVVPSGDWYQEKDDKDLLAGWLAASNGRPGLYLIMDGYTTEGVEHLVRANGPGSTYADDDQSVADQLSAYLDEVEVQDRYPADPARTTPYKPRTDRLDIPPERFTVGKAVANGLGGGVIGAMGGALLGGLVLGVAALVARPRGGKQ